MTSSNPSGIANEAKSKPSRSHICFDYGNLGARQIFSDPELTQDRSRMIMIVVLIILNKLPSKCMFIYYSFHALYNTLWSRGFEKFCMAGA